MTLLVHLEPLDSLFFRDARSFGTEDSTFAVSGDPSGLTLFGAVGSLVLATYEVELHEFSQNQAPTFIKNKLGEYDQELNGSRFRLQGPWWTFTGLQGEPELFFSPPANIMVAGNSTRPYPAWPEDPGARGGRKWDLDDMAPQLRPLRVAKPPPGASPLEPCTRYFSRDLLRSFLAGRLATLGGADGSSCGEEELYDRENRSLNRIEPGSWTVAEQFLFFTRHLRGRDRLEGNFYRCAGLAVVAHNLEPGDLGASTLFLGGEQRQARITCRRLESKLVPEDPSVLAIIQERKRFLLYLATPAIFSQGWHRQLWPFPEGAHLVAAAISKPGRLSGWERGGGHAPGHAGGHPRPFYRLAPAGSVYFFEAPEWPPEQFSTMYRQFHCGDSLSEKYPAAGLGVALIGSW